MTEPAADTTPLVPELPEDYVDTPRFPLEKLEPIARGDAIRLMQRLWLEAEEKHQSEG